MRRNLACTIAAAALFMLAVGSPALAGVPVVHKGVDMWTTVAGFAQTDFAAQPIPAGFFCPDSQPFTGLILFKGEPLAAEPSDSVGTIDTVVRRLDDVELDASGVGYTRIQLMALSLVSTRPIDTSCGSYNVAVRLDGEQPTTRMRITRTNSFGGTYAAPLALNVKLVFAPVAGDRSARRELSRQVNLGPAPHSYWAYATRPRYAGTPRIDTDGDGGVDTALPPASNFLAGVSPVAKANGPVFSPVQPSPAPIDQPVPACPVGLCPHQACHCNPDPSTWDPHDPGSQCSRSHMHCIWTCIECDIVISHQ